MAAYISVPRDLTKVKSKVAFNLTKRQLVCFGAAALIGVPLFFVLRDSGGNTAATLGMMAVKATANPFLDEAYFQKRKFDKGMHRLTGKFKMIWKNQNGLCYHCGMPMDVTEEREIFYLAPKAKAGMEDVRNMRYVHCTCQRIYAENRLKK